MKLSCLLTCSPSVRSRVAAKVFMKVSLRRAVRKVARTALCDARSPYAGSVSNIRVLRRAAEDSTNSAEHTMSFRGIAATAQPAHSTWDLPWPSPDSLAASLRLCHRNTR